MVVLRLAQAPEHPAGLVKVKIAGLGRSILTCFWVMPSSLVQEPHSENHWTENKPGGCPEAQDQVQPS